MRADPADEDGAPPSPARSMLLSRAGSDPRSKPSSCRRFSDSARSTRRDNGRGAGLGATRRTPGRLAPAPARHAPRGPRGGTGRKADAHQPGGPLAQRQAVDIRVPAVGCRAPVWKRERGGATKDVLIARDLLLQARAGVVGLVDEARSRRAGARAIAVIPADQARQQRDGQYPPTASRGAARRGPGRRATRDGGPGGWRRWHDVLERAAFEGRDHRPLSEVRVGKAARSGFRVLRMCLGRLVRGSRR